MIRIRKLVWDNVNEKHMLEKHDVTRAEVEEVCRNDHVSLEAQKGRVMVIGHTDKKRPLTVILDPTPELEVYYPATARPASRRERRLYKSLKKAYAKTA